MEGLERVISALIGNGAALTRSQSGGSKERSCIIEHEKYLFFLEHLHFRSYVAAILIMAVILKSKAILNIKSTLYIYSSVSFMS